MSESHTPGPWIKQGGYLTIYTLTDCATNAVAHTLHHANSNGSVVTREQAEANANLIAAAPDLLAALRRAHASMVLGMVAEVGSPIEKECRAALKKAGVDL